MQPARRRREQDREYERDRLRFRLQLGENDQFSLKTLRFFASLLDRIEALEKKEDV